ncbi:MAG: metallopeptidase family protein [Actinomycetaceae bacterium]|nr:metallopeptidase family protein [Actinomycetaceae bacterium]
MSNHYRPQRLPLRRGRGLRGVMQASHPPRWRRRSGLFDRLVQRVVRDLSKHYPKLSTIEFCVEDVPPSAPAPWESYGVILGRIFPDDRVEQLGMRLVVYRLPVMSRCNSVAELYHLLRTVITENAAAGLQCSPHDIDPDYTPESW